MCDLLICRICLNTDVNGYRLDYHNMRYYYQYIMRQKLNATDILPQWVCYECGMMLYKFHKFKKKCFHGNKLLRQIASRGEISYESVAVINRNHENLISLSIAKASKLIRTVIMKHKQIMKQTKIETEMNVSTPLEVSQPLPNDNVKINIATIINSKNKDTGNETTILDTKYTDNVKSMSNLEDTISSDAGKMYDTDAVKRENINEDKIKTFNKSTDSIISETKDLNDIIIQTNTNNIQNTDYDTNENNNELNTNTDFDTNFDTADSVKSSDDESLLDLAKKQGKVEKNSRIDKSKTKSRDKKLKMNDKEVVLKNTRPLKHVLSPQFWKKITLKEEEAMTEFKKREFSDYYLKAKFKCEDCYRGFSKNEMLVRHLKQRHHESCGNLECRFCRMRFKLRHQLVKHIKEHLIVYNCLHCKLQCTRLNNAITHQERHSGSKKTCKHCGKEFSHLSTYYTHVRMSHRSAHVCVACGASFVSELGLLQHTKLKHFDNVTQLEEEIHKRRETNKKPEDLLRDGKKLAETPQASAGEEIYCAKCDIQFMSRRAYNTHFFKSDNHDDGDAFAVLNKSRTSHRFRPRIPTSCEHCDKDFPSRQAYKKHHQAEHSHIPLYIPDERDICEICGASIQAKSIQYHMKSHTGEREFPCLAPTCGLRFTLKANMQRHYNVKHLGIVYPKYIRKNPGRRKKKMEEIHDNDFTPLVKTKTGYFL